MIGGKGTIIGVSPFTWPGRWGFYHQFITPLSHCLHRFWIKIDILIKQQANMKGE